jgi:hypothetical protein
VKPCPYCDWNDDHPYHYPDCPALEIASLRARIEGLEQFTNAAIAFNDAMRGDYIDAKPEERVTCVVKMSSLGAFVTAIDALKEG